jgi:molecular chaperone GrpE
LKYAFQGFILKILPILDNFRVIENNLSEEKKKDENIKGLLQMKIQLHDFLKKQGVEEIKCLGEKFNPEFQEVAEEIEIKDKESGVVIEEMQKGYKIHGKLLRPAKVKVSK